MARVAGSIHGPETHSRRGAWQLCGQRQPTGRSRVVTSDMYVFLETAHVVARSPQDPSGGSMRGNVLRVHVSIGRAARLHVRTERTHPGPHPLSPVIYFQIYPIYPAIFCHPTFRIRAMTTKTRDHVVPIAARARQADFLSAPRDSRARLVLSASSRAAAA